MSNELKPCPAECSEVERGLLDMAQRDNSALREAGFELAVAATRVVRDYDGLHRMSLALAGWFKAVADQGDRGSK